MGILLVLLGGAALSSVVRAAEPRPNLIVVVADDLGREWISRAGGAHHTPSIDRLADQGVWFENAWSTPICTPSRVELLTGRYPFRTGWTEHHDVPRWGGAGLDPAREVTFARLLRDAGYATAVAGKWQINDLREPGLLERHGFDEHCVWPGVERDNPASESRYWDPYLQTNGRRQVHSGEFGPDVVHRFAIDFIRRHRDRPLLVYYPAIIAHAPYSPTPPNRDSPPREPEQLYAGLVSYLDQLVGDLMRTLDETGMAGRTFVFFVADNGSPIAGGRIGEIVFPKSKSLLSDAGVHVPLAVRGPGVSFPGRGVEAPADLSDIFPTLLELAGVPPPPDVTIDGRSLVPVLRGGESHRQWAFTQLGTRRSVRNHRFKLDSDGAFWDLLRDPLEAHDLRDRCEPERAGPRERLGQFLAALPRDAPPPFTPFGRRAVQPTER